MEQIVIKSFNGIGDLLFVTPALRRIKEAYPNRRIVVNTNRPSLLQKNPFVDKVGITDKGVFLGYPGVAEGVRPTQHHIITDWQIVCKAYNLLTQEPTLKPELYVPINRPKRDRIGVQVVHKRFATWHTKRIWPHFEELSRHPGFEPIEEVTGKEATIDAELVKRIGEYRLLVTAEGGLTSIARALNIPCVVLYGGHMNPDWNGYTFHENLVSCVKCKWCWNDSPCPNNLMCWDEWTVDRVAQFALRTYMVRGFPNG